MREDRGIKDRTLIGKAAIYSGSIMKKYQNPMNPNCSSNLNKFRQTTLPPAINCPAGTCAGRRENAQIISDQIVHRLLEYTLHNGTHLFNVLSIMEELLPGEALQQLTPLECALCILAAFTHDLGMVMPDEDVWEISGSHRHA